MINVRSLLNVVPPVLEHSQSCEVCTERLRLLTPVRTLIGQAAVEEVPTRVVEAARNARRRLPAPLPPSIERGRLDYKRLEVPAFGVIAAAVVAVVGFGIYQSANNEQGPSQASRVRRLCNKPLPLGCWARLQ